MGHTFVPLEAPEAHWAFFLIKRRSGSGGSPKDLKAINWTMKIWDLPQCSLLFASAIPVNTPILVSDIKDCFFQRERSLFKTTSRPR